MVRSDVAWVSGDSGSVYKTLQASALNAQWVAVPANRIDLTDVDQYDFLGIECVPFLLRRTDCALWCDT
jgi:hypothetical protein